MSNVFDALLTGDTNGVLASSKAFVEAVHTRDLRMAKTSAFSFDVYSDRCRSQLGSLPPDKLESIRQATAFISGRAQDSVVSGIHAAAGAELLMRTVADSKADGAAFVLSGLSPDQLRTLKHAASHLLDNAPKAALSDVIPGTKCTRAALEEIRDGVYRALAIKVVLANHFKSADELAELPTAELIETAWAVAWCRSLGIDAPHGTQWLSDREAGTEKTLWGNKLKALAAAIQELQARSATVSSGQRSNSSGL